MEEGDSTDSHCVLFACAFKIVRRESMREKDEFTDVKMRGRKGNKWQSCVSLCRAGGKEKLWRIGVSLEMRWESAASAYIRRRSSTKSLSNGHHLVERITFAPAMCATEQTGSVQYRVIRFTFCSPLTEEILQIRLQADNKLWRLAYIFLIEWED